jgi:hypothetical protein
MCKMQKIDINAEPSCPSAFAAPFVRTGNASIPNIATDASITSTGSTATVTAGAPVQNAGAAFGFGAAIVGLLVALKKRSRF